MLLAGAPAAAVAVAVTLTSVVAWTGYAAMRAELAALDRRATAITWYTVCIAGIEAAGAAAAALLPTGPAGTVTGHLLLGVVAFYGACLIPTFAIARNARVPRAKRRTGSPRIGRPAPALAAGFAVMLLASGPTLLSVALAAQLYGRAWVAASAAAFTAGSLLAPGLATVLERARLPAAATWPALGIGMIAGWIVAPVHVAGLLVAQALSGLCMTALEGTMDARVAAEHANQPVTAGLAWSAAARALGSSAAVAAAPTLMAATAVATFSAATTAVLAAAAVLAVAAPLMRKQRRAPSREARLRTRTPAALELVDPPRPQRATAAP
jgi:hypothetical protein